MNRSLLACSPARLLACSPASLLALAGLVESSAVCHAATFTVNAWDERDFNALCPSDPSCDDWESATGQGYDGVCDSTFVAASTAGPGTDCTLRDAITEANNNDEDDVILVPVSPTQPSLPSGGYPLSRLSSATKKTEDNNVWDDLDAWDTSAGWSLVLRGVDGSSPAPVSIWADWDRRHPHPTSPATYDNELDRILHVPASGGGRFGVDVELDGVSMYGGTVEDTAFGSTGGGCIAQLGGDLEIRGAEIGGCHAVPQGGGGILVTGALVLEGALISQNRVNASPGGGVYASGPVATFETEFDGKSSSFGNNKAEVGGGAYIVADDIDVVDSDFYGNYAVSKGGGVYVRGFDAVGSDPVFDRTTFANNEVLQRGGAGLCMDGHPTTAGRVHTLLDCTFSGNFLGHTSSPPVPIGPGAIVQRGMALYVDLPGGSSPIDVDVIQTTFNDNILTVSHATLPYQQEYRTVFLNSAGSTLRLQNTIIDGDCEAPSGTLSSLGGNVYWDETSITGHGCPTTTSDIVGDQYAGYGSIPFDALAANGGAWSRSHSTVSTKASASWPWVDTDFEAKTCLGDLSQNLVSRPSSGSICDAGSYEP